MEWLRDPYREAAQGAGHILAPRAGSLAGNIPRSPPSLFPRAPGGFISGQAGRPASPAPYCFPGRITEPGLIRERPAEPGGERPPGPDVQLREDVPQVEFDGLHAHEKLLRGLPVRPAGSDE